MAKRKIQIKWQTSDGRLYDSKEEAQFQQQRMEQKICHKEYWDDPVQVGHKSVGPDRLADWIRRHSDWVQMALEDCGNEYCPEPDEIPF